jgi:hypothetical protein
MRFDEDVKPSARTRSGPATPGSLKNKHDPPSPSDSPRLTWCSPILRCEGFSEEGYAYWIVLETDPRNFIPCHRKNIRAPSGKVYSSLKKLAAAKLGVRVREEDFVEDVTKLKHVMVDVVVNKTLPESALGDIDTFPNLLPEFVVEVGTPRKQVKL